MFNYITDFSLKNKLLVILGVLFIIVFGVYSASKIPLDAVPDITNNQVQVVSVAPTLAPQEVEQLITFPLENSFKNVPGVVEVRSISRYGLSIITIVFNDDVPTMTARQYVQENINIVKNEIPSDIASPELMPVTTGLGEIYQYALVVDEEQASKYDATELRTIQDWIIKRQLSGTKGIIEVSSFGGYVKQFEVSVYPAKLIQYGITLNEVIESLERNNDNNGSAYLEKGTSSIYIRTLGRFSKIEDIENTAINHNGIQSVRIRDIAKIKIGSDKRYGAMTMDGKGEVVGGITLMLKGANSSEALENVKVRIDEISKNLPEGVHIYPYLDRSQLIGKTIDTVSQNLIEGGLIVILVLLLLLGNFRAGLIVASVIPLSMLFALIMMNQFGVSANLMSLGAIDFGIVVDGAVIIIEHLLHSLSLSTVGRKLTKQEMNDSVRSSTSKIYRSAAFGVLIILVVFIPILTLEGTEGKTFRPMAQTVSFAIIGSMILSLTYVPVMSAIFMRNVKHQSDTWSDQIINKLKFLYLPTLKFSLNKPLLVIANTLLIFVVSIILFTRLGSEFVPTLEEGDLAMQLTLKAGSSLTESIQATTLSENLLIKNFPEVKHVVSKIGTAEVPTDPMAIENADIMIILKDKSEWVSTDNREELIEQMKNVLSKVTWATFEFSQPIQLRFNELMTGSKSDISIKIFGENVEKLKEKADEAALIIERIQGAEDVKVDQTEGLKQMLIKYDRDNLSKYGIDIDDLNQIIRSLNAGEKVGRIFEDERKFDLVVRMKNDHEQKFDLNKIYARSNAGLNIPISSLAEVEFVEGPMLISREDARRFINIGVNVRQRDVAGLVGEIKDSLNSSLNLEAGYNIVIGGQYENLEKATQRLIIAVPIAFFLILVLLYTAFNSLKDTLTIFIAVPLSLVGGILALYLRGMPFSISAGIGFIVLFGVSVLNGIVLMSSVKQSMLDNDSKLMDIIIDACKDRMRPVLMTAAVAALGFLPMAISSGSGAEVQRPLATVVIGGLISSTFLTLVVLPTIYYMLKRKEFNSINIAAILILISFTSLNASEINNETELLNAVMNEHPKLKSLDLQIEQMKNDPQKIVDWQDVQLNYQVGQINYNNTDHMLSLTQDIAPIFRIEQKNNRVNLINSKVDNLNIQRVLVRADLERSILSLYFELEYFHFRKTDLDSLLKDLEKIRSNINNRFETGDISSIERSMIMNQVNIYQLERNDIESKIMQFENEIKSIGYLSDEILFNFDTELSTNSVPEIINDSSNIHLEIFRSRNEIFHNEIELEKNLMNKLDLSFTVTTQSLEQIYSYQTVGLNLSLPIDRRKGKKQIQIYQLQQKENEIMANYQQNLIDKTISSLIQRYKALTAGLDDNMISMIKSNSENSKKNFSLYELGEIDLLTYIKLEEQNLSQKNFFYLKIKELKDLNNQIRYLSKGN